VPTISKLSPNKLHSQYGALHRGKDKITTKRKKKLQNGEGSSHEVGTYRAKQSLDHEQVLNLFQPNSTMLIGLRGVRFGEEHKFGANDLINWTVYSAVHYVGSCAIGSRGSLFRTWCRSG